jgi:hypothetical protein
MSVTAPMTVPLPEFPADGLVEPFATTGEVALLIVGALLTIAVAGFTITFFVRMQRREMHRD